MPKDIYLLTRESMFCMNSENRDFDTMQIDRTMYMNVYGCVRIGTLGSLIGKNVFCLDSDGNSIPCQPIPNQTLMIENDDEGVRNTQCPQINNIFTIKSWRIDTDGLMVQLTPRSGLGEDRDANVQNIKFVLFLPKEIANVPPGGPLAEIDGALIQATWVENRRTKMQVRLPGTGVTTIDWAPSSGQEC